MYTNITCQTNTNTERILRYSSAQYESPSTAWADACSGTSATIVTGGGNNPYLSMAFGYYVDTSTYNYWADISRGIYPFSTSSIPDTAVIDSATVNVNVYSQSGADTDYRFWTTSGVSSPAQDADFDAFVSLASNGFNGTSTGWKSATLTPAGLSAINKTGTTNFMLRSHTYDAGGSLPSGPDTTHYLYVYWAYSAYDPYLLVNYYVPVAGRTQYADAYIRHAAAGYYSYTYSEFRRNSGTGYAIGIYGDDSGTTSFNLQKMVNGTWSTVGSIQYSETYSSDFRIEAVGSSIKIYYHPTNTEVASWSDSTYTTIGDWFGDSEVANGYGEITAGTDYPVSGTISGIGATSVTIQVNRNLSGTVSGMGSYSGTLINATSFTGSISGSSAYTGTASVDLRLIGSIAGQSSANATLAVSKALSGTIDGSCNIYGDLTTAGAPDAPAWVTASIDGTHRRVDWDAVDDATSYEIYRRVDGGDWEFVEEVFV